MEFNTRKITLNKYNMKKIILILAITFFTLSSLPVFAQGLFTDRNQVSNNTSKFANSANLSDKDLGFVAKDVIGIVLSFLALIFLTLIIVSGFQWMTAGGNEETVGKAKKRLINSVIGLIIVLAAYGITYFIFTKIPFSGGATLTEAV